MPLLIVCGHPCTGKTKVAETIATALRSRGAAVELLNEETLGIDRSTTYASTTREKEARGRLQSAAVRLMSKDVVVIVDSINYIKGFRYYLYCSAKEHATTSAVVYVTAPRRAAIAWNAARTGGYKPHDMTELWRRFEVPDESNRWARPLFTLRQGLGVLGGLSDGHGPAGHERQIGHSLGMAAGGTGLEDDEDDDVGGGGGKLSFMQSRSASEFVSALSAVDAGSGAMRAQEGAVSAAPPRLAAAGDASIGGVAAGAAGRAGAGSGRLGSGGAGARKIGGSLFKPSKALLRRKQEAMVAKADRVAEASALAEGETAEDRARLAAEAAAGGTASASGGDGADDDGGGSVGAASIGSDAAIGAGDDEDAAERLALIGQMDGKGEGKGDKPTAASGVARDLAGAGGTEESGEHGSAAEDQDAEENAEFPPKGVVDAVVAALLDSAAPKPHMSVSVAGQASGALASSIERVVEEVARQVAAKAALADPGQTIAIDLAACGAAPTGYAGRRGAVTHLRMLRRATASQLRTARIEYMRMIRAHPPQSVGQAAQQFVAYLQTQFGKLVG